MPAKKFDAAESTAKPPLPKTDKKVSTCVQIPVDVVRRLDVAVAQERARRGHMVGKSEFVVEGLIKHLEEHGY